MFFIIISHVVACAGIFLYALLLNRCMRRIEGKERKRGHEEGVALLVSKALYLIFSTAAILSDPHTTRSFTLEFTAITAAEFILYLYLYSLGSARKRIRNRRKVKTLEYVIETYFIAALAALGAFLIYLFTFRGIFALPFVLVGIMLLTGRTLLYAKKIRNKEGAPMLEKQQIKKLTEEAEKAFEASYAPYSGFAVGAAIMAAGGKIYRGCNVESATFTPTSCAERSALVSAVSSGERKFLAIAIVGGKDGKIGDACPPCGVCRQFLAEFCEDEFEIYLKESGGDIQRHTLGEYLPDAFRGDRL